MSVVKFPSLDRKTQKIVWDFVSFRDLYKSAKKQFVASRDELYEKANKEDSVRDALDKKNEAEAEIAKLRTELERAETRAKDMSDEYATAVHAAVGKELDELAEELDDIRESYLCARDDLKDEEKEDPRTAFKGRKYGTDTTSYYLPGDARIDIVAYQTPESELSGNRFTRRDEKYYFKVEVTGTPNLNATYAAMNKHREHEHS